MDLAQWFADDVNINEDKVYSFEWDGEESSSRTKAAQRTNDECHVLNSIRQRPKRMKDDPKAYIEIETRS